MSRSGAGPLRLADHCGVENTVVQQDYLLYTELSPTAA